MNIQYCDSDRSKCKGCKQKFGVGTLRVEKPNIYGHGSGYVPGWFHLHCYEQENVIPITLNYFLEYQNKYKKEDLQTISDFIFECNEVYQELYSKKRKRDSIGYLLENEVKKKKFDSSVDLPIEIWEHIIHYSDDFNILANLSSVSHDFYELTQNNELWSILLKNFNHLWDENTRREAKLFLELKMRSLDKTVMKEPPSKMIFIRLFEQSCVKCHGMASYFYVHVDGNVCHRCSFNFHFISGTEAKKKFHLTENDLDEIPCQKYPTTRGTAPYTREFEMTECLKYSQKSKFKEIQEYVEKDAFEDVFKREFNDIIRVFIEIPFEKSVRNQLLKKIKSGEKTVEGYLSCTRSKKPHKLLDINQRTDSKEMNKICSNVKKSEINCSHCIQLFKKQNEFIEVMNGNYIFKLENQK
eukprot:gene10019-2338_t